MRQNVFKGGLRQLADFIVAAILNGMRHIMRRRRKAQGFALRFCRLDKFARSDKHGGDAPRLYVRDVMHTARRARPSIGKRLDHDIAFIDNFVL